MSVKAFLHLIVLNKYNWRFTILGLRKASLADRQGSWGKLTVPSIGVSQWRDYTIKQVKDQRIIVRRPWFLFSWVLKRCHSAFINRGNTARLQTCTWGPCTLRENMLPWHFANLILGKKNWLFCSLKPCCCNNYSCTCTLWEGKLTFLLIS